MLVWHTTLCAIEKVTNDCIFFGEEVDGNGGGG